MKFRFRFAMPWYYTPYGFWLLGFWNLMYLKGYPEWGFRIVGFEFRFEYF